jgi:hypothetical protein
MKKLFLIAAAFAALTVAAPANAQVNIRAGEHGVGVRVGPAPGVHRHGNWRRANARTCRVMKTRTVTPGGRVIVKTRRVCR